MKVSLGTVVVAIVILLIAGGGVWAYAQMQTNVAHQPVACTDEAKICPDGSAVGRTGPNCEFAACPDATSTPVAGGAGAHCGGFIQNAPTCNAGFHCVLKVNMPDTGGTCVADAPAGTGVMGSVQLGPTCPVMRDPPDPSCADKGYATTVTAYHSNSSDVVATTQSDSTGAFHLALPSGSYVLTAKGGATLPRCNAVTVTVTAGGYAPATISCDTGIR